MSEALRKLLSRLICILIICAVADALAYCFGSRDIYWKPFVFMQLFTFLCGAIARFHGKAWQFLLTGLTVVAVSVLIYFAGQQGPSMIRFHLIIIASYYIAFWLKK